MTYDANDKKVVSGSQSEIILLRIGPGAPPLCLPGGFIPPLQYKTDATSALTQAKMAETVIRTGTQDGIKTPHVWKAYESAEFIWVSVESPTISRNEDGEVVAVWAEKLLHLRPSMGSMQPNLWRTVRGSRQLKPWICSALRERFSTLGSHSKDLVLGGDECGAALVYPGEYLLLGSWHNKQKPFAYIVSEEIVRNVSRTPASMRKRDTKRKSRDKPASQEVRPTGNVVRMSSLSGAGKTAVGLPGPVGEDEAEKKPTLSTGAWSSPGRSIPQAPKLMVAPPPSLPAPAPQELAPEPEAVEVEAVEVEAVAEVETAEVEEQAPAPQPVMGKRSPIRAEAPRIISSAPRRVEKPSLQDVDKDGESYSDRSADRKRSELHSLEHLSTPDPDVVREMEELSETAG